jgi:hypothetical protein
MRDLPLFASDAAVTAKCEALVGVWARQASSSPGHAALPTSSETSSVPTPAFAPSFPARPAPSSGTAFPAPSASSSSATSSRQHDRTGGRVLAQGPRFHIPSRRPPNRRGRPRYSVLLQDHRRRTDRGCRPTSRIDARWCLTRRSVSFCVPSFPNGAPPSPRAFALHVEAG